jgi:hypothetical protein
MSEQKKTPYIILCISLIGIVVFSIWFGIENSKTVLDFKTDEEKQNYEIRKVSSLILMLLSIVSFIIIIILIVLEKNKKKVEFRTPLLNVKTPDSDDTPPSANTMNALKKSFPTRTIPPLKL